MTVIDLTHTIREDMPVYPGTEQPRLTTACTVSQCGYRETLLHMYSHTGTHMDAPAHMIDGALTLDGCGAVRVHGGGFGGAVQCFVPADMAEDFAASVLPFEAVRLRLRGEGAVRVE